MWLKGFALFSNSSAVNGVEVWEGFHNQILCLHQSITIYFHGSLHLRVMQNDELHGPITKAFSRCYDVLSRVPVV